MENLKVDLASIPGDPEVTADSVRAAASGNGGSTAEGSSDKPERVVCQYCGHTYLASRIANHKKKCRRHTRAGTPGRGAAVDPPEQLPAEAPEAKPIEITPDMIGVAFSGIFDVIALREGPFWRLSSIESETLGVQWKNVLDAFEPRLGGKQLILFFAIAATWSVVGERITQSLNERRKKSGVAHVSRPEREREDLPIARVS